jgi:hypothetical protein
MGSTADPDSWFNEFCEPEEQDLLHHLHSMNRLDANAPTVLWRMSRERSTAHATIFPGDSQTTITWFFDGVMDRAENYESMELALARGDEIRGVLERDGWRMA